MSVIPELRSREGGKSGMRDRGNGSPLGTQRRASTAWVERVVTDLSLESVEAVLRINPGAQVQDVSDVLLKGALLEAVGPTRRVYLRVYRKLLRARTRLGLPPPGKHSVARFRR